jgi:KDO2-lipid IV(A) lauroyltransferase
VKARLFRFAAWLCSLLPPKRAEWVARPAAALIWRFSGRLREVSRTNLRLCYPDLAEDERETRGREALVHYTRTVLELGVTWCWPPDRFEALFEPPVGREHLRQARSRGRGVVLLAPHFGAWEMLGLSLSGDLDATLYKPSGDAELDRMLRENRERFGARLVPAGRRGLRMLLQCLEAGGAVALLPDQEPRAGDGRFAPFFGVPALTGVLAARLLQRTGARAVFAVCVREDGGRYRQHILPADEDIYSEELDTALAAVNRGVEACIGLAPQQYLWAYKRFREQPGTEDRRY